MHALIAINLSFLKASINFNLVFLKIYFDFIIPYFTPLTNIIAPSQNFV